jgi:very-long-chain (3R)-3-hydroxyacyl-CoA dehydratase
LLQPYRYTAFIPLYPVGVLGEMASMWYALPLLRQRGLHSVTLPNTWNFGFDYSVFLTVRLQKHTAMDISTALHS